MLLYKSMKSAYLEYHAQLWFFHLEKDIIELEKMTIMLQCCWLRGIKQLPDGKEINSLDLCSLEKIWLRMNMIKSFKTMNGIKNLNRGWLFIIFYTTRTRRQPVKWSSSRFKTNERNDFSDNTHLNYGIKLPWISVEVKSINGSKCD